ncbi:MAG: electron transporter RnfD [Lachnospirales bacterium]
MNINLNSEKILYCGRLEMNTENKPELIFPASSIQFSFVGKKATLEVSNRKAYWKNSLGAIINGKQYKFPLNSKGVTQIDLVDEEVEKEHNILVFKRMDSCHVVTIEKIVLSDNSKLIPIQNIPKRCIEVYGDSISAGEVSEATDYIGKVDPDTHNGEFSNSWYSYSWMLARKLNARLHCIAQGGIPLMTGTGWLSPPVYLGMEDVWDKVHFHPDFKKTTLWDFSKYTPQLVIVAIGQNCSNPDDFMYNNPKGEKAKLWKEKYKNLVLSIRIKYPKATIILTTTIMVHHTEWDDAIEEVYQDLKYDEKIRHFLYRRNGCGTVGHLRIPEAEEMAKELEEYVNSLDIDVWEDLR